MAYNKGIVFLQNQAGLVKTSKINNILLSPLDWGLGHTTRCFPLIDQYLAEGCRVFIACQPGSASEKMLMQAYPQITYLPLQGYNITYSRTRKGFIAKIAGQAPKILSAIRNEHRFVEAAVMRHGIDLVVSDNRYGFYSRKVRSVFITHQLSIRVPCRFLQAVVQRINYSFINKFSECLVPDFADKDMNLAGRLSHPEKWPSIPVKYIGPLSRLKPVPGVEKKYDLLVLLSGPEPQRSILEEKLLEVLPYRMQRVLLVRGLPNATEKVYCENVRVENYLGVKDLSQAIAQSEFVLARAGYTTVMEMICLQKRSILIPTPGQTEQEYLAKRLHQQQWAFCFSQGDDIQQRLDQAMQFNFMLPALQA